mgnify:FL=1
MELRSLLAENLKKYGFPYPLNKKDCHKWSDLPRQGETVFYTSCMYQTASLSKELVNFLPMADKLSSLSFLASRFIKPKDEDLERSSRIFRRMVDLLRRAGVKDLAYLYEEEPYSGAILLELGYLDLFAEHAERVYNFFKSKGVKRVITVDPHTHNALKRYPEFVKGFDIEVVNVYDLVKDLDVKGNYAGELTVHDSCLYSRFLNLRDAYRGLISRSGLRLKEDFMVTGKDTAFCCGSPIAVVDKDLSEKIAETRARELRKLSDKAIVVCPMCYAQLKDKIEVVDLMEVVE